jgi:formylglycine-generating enzyme required for sulfatase activity
MYKVLSILSILFLLLTTSVAAQSIAIDMVPVGNLYNAPDATDYGEVDYSYQIGKCEITAGQYTAFLNSVARTSDTYGLYNTSMWTGAAGCKIQQTYSNGTFAYSVAANYANRPVSYVSWGDAARFCNWLSNGQLNTGAEDLTTTEDGSYYLNGATSSSALMAVTRKDGASYVIPSENEWYKAAYYDPNKNGIGNGGYWLFPTKSNAAPNHVYPSLGTNSANWYDYYDPHNNGYTLNGPPYTTEVGSFSNSKSAYGTLDQGGNVEEWNEAVVSVYPAAPPSSRGLRGGSYNSGAGSLMPADRNIQGEVTLETPDIGYRLAYAPEPGSLIIILSAMLPIIISKKLIFKNWHF